MRRRGELVERSFAHCYDTGGMRRTHLREHPNILKRLLIHAAGFNLSLILRKLLGFGTARGLQGLSPVSVKERVAAALRRSGIAFRRLFARLEELGGVLDRVWMVWSHWGPRAGATARSFSLPARRAA
jgi:hypothetical protein